MYFLALMSDQSPQWLQDLLQPQVLGIVGSLVGMAIIGSTIVAVVKAVIRHRERMALLKHGINPDADGEGTEAAGSK